jgi:hypothetical protein
VKWSGYVKPDYAGVYTFSTTIAGTDDRIRLWVDDQYIVNLWGTVAPASVSNTATIKLSSNTLYDIKLDYKDTSASAAVALYWIRNNLAAVIVPSDRLIGYTAHVAGSPFTSTVFPALTCGSLSTATGQGVSLATAGIPASFTIVAVDHLGNRATSSTDVFTVRARYATTTDSDVVGTVLALGNGLYAASYTPVMKRNNQTVTNNKQWHDVIASLAVPGSLIATYYHASAPTVPVATATAALTSSATPPGVTQAYNARYLGFIQPPYATWTFSVSTAAGTTVSYINGKQLLSGVGATTIVGTAANSLYDIEISVASATSSTSPVVAILLDGSQLNLVAASGRVFQRQDLSFKVFDSSGLQATFYNTGAFNTPSTHALVSNIDWSYATNSAKYVPHAFPQCIFVTICAGTTPQRHQPARTACAGPGFSCRQ